MVNKKKYNEWNTNKRVSDSDVSSSEGLRAAMEADLLKKQRRGIRRSCNADRTKKRDSA
jgi:hypothetical protein